MAAKIDTPHRIDTRALADAATRTVRASARVYDVRASGGRKPRFERFHSRMSLCSQKMRAVPAEMASPDGGRRQPKDQQ